MPFSVPGAPRWPPPCGGACGACAYIPIVITSPVSPTSTHAFFIVNSPVWVCHSPPDKGGVDATSRRSREASFNGADGVVGNETISPEERIPKRFGNPNHPVCAAAWLRIFFLMAQPPLLCQEGSGAPNSFTSS